MRNQLSRNLAIVSIALLVLAPLLYRLQLGPVMLPLLLFPVAVLCAVVALVAGAWGLRHGLRAEGSRWHLVGVGLSLVPIATAALFVNSGRGMPAIHDVTTDVNDPPVFVTAPTLPRRAVNSLEFDPKTIPLQRQAFPDLRSIVTDEPPAAAFEHARKTAEQLGWEIYAADAAAGRIEAVETTKLFGYEDDVVIRVRPAAGGSVIDLRSVSRVGEGDLGANARRIRRFVEAYQAE
jgi:hypothetical protein